ncbi:hypothetical protein HH1059_15490 [Halorhodospira halochloris]|uniref:Outer membrane protein beta-barrel domain-containing protein n=1 Tax=Halorhodospira halochloris TaxID=1052 RepID=A0A110B5G0_HALHR|nr:porin family protein [Halorhodospira halochloris]MBK1651964.1 hypothetical protein [Halorhodospira halochloris]BAU58256.1 hypothetical protein HH1059_15490 [Halorhodospira halochloris]
MRCTRLKFIVIGSALAMSTPVSSFQIVHEVYIGVGAMPWNYEGERDETSATGGRLIAGTLLTDRFGIEAHFGMYGEDKVSLPAKVRIELDSLDGVFLRLNQPLFEYFNVYTLAGFSSVQMIVSPEEAGAEEDAPTASGFSLGAGAEINLGDHYAVGIDYVRYLDEPDFMFQAVTSSLKWRF